MFLCADGSLTSGIRRKRLDVWAVHWGRGVVHILNSNCPNYSRPNGTAPSRAELLLSFPMEGRDHDLLTGHTGSYNELKWQTDLDDVRFEVRPVDKLMLELVDRCLTA